MVQINPENNNSVQIQPPQIQRTGETKKNTIDRLAAELKVANMAKIYAERKLIQLKDQFNQKEKLYEISSQQCDSSWEIIAEYKNKLSAQDIVIKKLKAQAQEYPHSNSSLVKSHQQLSDIIDSIRECFTCPLCYQNLTKGLAVSLRCGHTFCQTCIDTWATTQTGKLELNSTPNSKIVMGGEEEGKMVQCPECRTNSTSRIRLYMLEEAIRLLDRAERQRQSTILEEQSRRLELESIDPSKPIPPADYLS